MNVHPIITPASPFLASPHFDASFDSIESLTTTFASPEVPTLETTTVTEVALGYHRNQQYSITAMTTSTGAVAERYAYTAYGQPTILNASGSVLTSSAVGNRYTYTGREWDESLGLHHFRARWICPLAGRFLGRDPIGYVDGYNSFELQIGLAFFDPAGTSVTKNDELLSHSGLYKYDLTRRCWEREDWNRSICNVEGDYVPGHDPDEFPGGFPEVMPKGVQPEPILWGEEIARGTDVSNEMPTRDELTSVSDECTCVSPYLRYSRARPSGKNGVHPLPGHGEVDCEIGQHVVKRYPFVCMGKNDKPCEFPWD